MNVTHSRLWTAVLQLPPVYQREGMSSALKQGRYARQETGGVGCAPPLLKGQSLPVPANPLSSLPTHSRSNLISFPSIGQPMTRSAI